MQFSPLFDNLDHFEDDPFLTTLPLDRGGLRGHFNALTGYI